MAVWTGAKAKAIKEINSEESDDKRGTGPDGRRLRWEDSKKAEDQEAGIDAHERVGCKTARATSAMRTAQQLHQRQQDADDDASGNFAKEGEFAQDDDFAQEGNVAEEGGSIATVKMDQR